MYRRWRNCAEPAQEMLARATADPFGAHRSNGDLRSDLIGLLSDMAGFLSGPYGEAVRCDVQGDPSQ